MTNGAGPDKPFYVRLMVVDQPGVLAAVTAILRKHDISIEGLLQQGRAPVMRGLSNDNMKPRCQLWEMR